MSARSIKVRLTDAQFAALADAVAQSECDWEADGETDRLRVRETLLRAWAKLNAAWYDAARPRHRP